MVSVGANVTIAPKSNLECSGSEAEAEICTPQNFFRLDTWFSDGDGHEVPATSDSTHNVAPSKVAHSLLSQPPQDLRHPGPADAEVACERRPPLELAGVEQRLVIAGQLERIAAFLRGGFRFGFGVGKGIPGQEGDDGRTT